MSEQTDAMRQEELVEIVADIVSAYVSNNPVQRGDLPQLIETVHSSMATLASGNGASQTEAPTPATSVKSSVKKDYIVCLDCGKTFKSLKRHISTYHDMTPEEYRQKWQLPSSYPMVAPNYSAARSQLAHTMGLGRKPKVAKKTSRKQAR